MITTYQIRNVLRIYGNQLKKRTMLLQDNVSPNKQPSDFVDISVEARRKQMFNQISNNLVSQITHNGLPPKLEGNIAEGNLPLNLDVERKSYEN